MAFVINVIKWLLWTVKTMYQAEFIIPFWCETLVNTSNKGDVDPMLAHRLRRVQPSKHKCFVFAGNGSWSGIPYCCRQLQSDTDPMSVKCWASVAVLANIHSVLVSTSCCRYLHTGGTGTML